MTACDKIGVICCPNQKLIQTACILTPQILWEAYADPSLQQFSKLIVDPTVGSVEKQLETTTLTLLVLSTI